jgi:RNA polymerase sigma-70 factor (ECF subfamily)
MAMFDNTNPYTLRSEIVDGINRYYVSFIDSEAMPRETEVSRPVYVEFLRFVKVERNLRRSDERHLEQSDLTENNLFNRALCQPKSICDIAFDSQLNEQLRLAIQGLTEIQRRRFVLYHEFGLTYEQIAEMEGCTKMPVIRAIDRAEEKIREQIKYFKM